MTNDNYVMIFAYPCALFATQKLNFIQFAIFAVILKYKFIDEWKFCPNSIDKTRGDLVCCLICKKWSHTYFSFSLIQVTTDRKPFHSFSSLHGTKIKTIVNDSTINHQPFPSPYHIDRASNNPLISNTIKYQLNTLNQQNSCSLSQNIITLQLIERTKENWYANEYQNLID